LLDRILPRAALVAAPPPDMTVTEWAEKNRVMSVENCAIPGKYRVSVTPFIKGPLDAITDRKVRKVVMQKSAQVAWTDGVLNNFVGYIIDQDPGPAIVLFPGADLAEAYSTKKLALMIRDTECLKSKVADPKSKTSRNTILSKSFTGGSLELVGSNAPANMSSHPCRYILIEEPDRCARNSGGEGNSLKLIHERGKTFHNLFELVGGSPTIDQASEIQREMEMSDKRRYFIPCPHCGEMQTLEWDMVVCQEKDELNHPVFGKTDPSSAMIYCKKNGCGFTNAEKNLVLPRGEWRATAPFSGIAGFYINEIYSPFPGATIYHMAEKYLEAKKFQDAGDNTLMITFTNTSLGEVWKEAFQEMDKDELSERVENFNIKNIPPEVLYLTCFVDVQGDRLEGSITGWGPGQPEEAFVLDYFVLKGDPEGKKIWLELDEIIFAVYCGKKIAITGIDSGYLKDAVYRYCKPRERRRVFPTKGVGTENERKPLVGNPSKGSIDKKIKLYPIGVDTAKDSLYNRLQVTEPGAGCIHFGNQLPENYFDMLTAEKIIIKYKKGVARRIYDLPSGKRNEALDIFVGNMAILAILKSMSRPIRLKLLGGENTGGQVPQKPKRKTGTISKGVEL